MRYRRNFSCGMRDSFKLDGSICRLKNRNSLVVDVTPRTAAPTRRNWDNRRRDLYKNSNWLEFVGLVTGTKIESCD